MNEIKNLQANKIASQTTEEEVAIKACTQYKSKNVEKSIEECVGLIGGFKKYIGDAKNILLKPNLLSPSRPELAVTTHPVFVEAMTRLVKRNARPDAVITIADSPGIATLHTEKDLIRLYNQCGYPGFADIENVKLNLDERHFPVSFKQGKLLKKFEVIKPAIDADIIINLPKFKTHSLTKITGAVKNMFGIIYGREKTLLHTKFMDIGKFCDMLLDIYQFKIPVLNIMDGITGLEGEGPGASGKPRNAGIILASSSAIALDNVMASIMGFNSEDIPIILSAKKRNITGWDSNYIKILGGQIKDFIIDDYKLPRNSAVGKISSNRFINAFILPFVRNNLSVSPYQNQEKCTMCRICIEICPEKAIKSRDSVLVFDYKKCIRCYCCSEMCPEGAIDLNYSWFGNLIFREKKIK